METRRLDTMTREEIEEMLRTQESIPVIISRNGKVDRGIMRRLRVDEYTGIDFDHHYTNYYHIFSGGKILNGG